MRLVDADELNLCNVHLIDGKMVCDAPTIHAVPIEVLQEIRHEIETAQTYKIASGSHDLYIDRDNALEIIDGYIEQYKEDAE